MLRLTAVREERGWSRSELARRAGLNSVTVGQIELRRLSPYASQLRKIAGAFGLPESEAERLMEEAAPEGVLAA